MIGCELDVKQVNWMETNVYIHGFLDGSRHRLSKFLLGTVCLFISWHILSVSAHTCGLRSDDSQFPYFINLMSSLAQLSDAL